MNVALLPVAAARASMVLLQPGGPCSSTPLGGDSPSRLNTSAATNTHMVTTKQHLLQQKLRSACASTATSSWSHARLPMQLQAYGVVDCR
jgi:hypothetical protein